MADNLGVVISEEIFAAWLDGGMTQDEESAFLNTCASDADMQEILDANDQVDECYEYMVEVGYDLPCEFNTDFVIPLITVCDEDVELSSYDNAETFNQEGADENEEAEYQEDNDIDFTNSSSLEESGMNEFELIY